MDIPAHRRCIWVSPIAREAALTMPAQAGDVAASRAFTGGYGVASNPTTRSVAAALSEGRPMVNAFVTGASSSMDAILRGSAEAVRLAERSCIHHIR